MSNPTAPRDSAVAVAVPAQPVKAAAIPAQPVAAVAVHPNDSDQPPPAAAPAPSGDLWMPPWANGAPPPARRGTRYSGAVQPDVESELERVRAHLEQVARERDLLRGHVKSMEKLVHQQVGRSYPSAAAPRPGSAPHARPGSSSARSHGGRSRSPNDPRSGSQSARRLTPEEKEERAHKREQAWKRITKPKWRMDPQKQGSGVEQLKAKLDAEEKKQRLKTKEELQQKRFNKKMSKEDIERLSAEMFQRAKDTRAKLDREMAKRQEAQLPPAKKSTSSAKERAMRFQLLSMPAHKVNREPESAAKVWEARGVKLPKKQPEPTPAPSLKGGSSARGEPARPAWFAGTSKTKLEERRWEAGAILGRNARAGAVH
jgi:hypothetical protein